MSDFPKRTVYLSGPITGLTYGEAKNGWRPTLAHMLKSHIHALSPMRVVGSLQPEQGLLDVPEAEGVRSMLVNRAILARDETDLRMADAVVANFLGAKRVSIGTVSELGMAHILRIPVVIVMEDKDNVHEHPFVTAIASFRTADLFEAAEIINHLLTPGV